MQSFTCFCVPGDSESCGWIWVKFLAW